jgi:hypothetical protein
LACTLYFFIHMLSSSPVPPPTLRPGQVRVVTDLLVNSAYRNRLYLSSAGRREGDPRQ